MCGRFVSASPPEEIANYFGADIVEATLEPNYNVSPTSDVYIVYEDGTTRIVDAFHWGLIPGWAKDTKIASKLINARSETAAEKNAFRSSLSKRRCIVPVDSFYEWKQIPGKTAAGKGRKQPYRIVRPDGEPFAIAGLWSEWHGQIAGQEMTVRSTTMLTGEPNEKMAEIHHRMPILLPPDAWSEWLDPTLTDVAEIGRFLVPAPKELISFHPVSTEVNNARNAGSHLIDVVDVGDEGHEGEVERGPDDGQMRLL